MFMVMIHMFLKTASNLCWGSKWQSQNCRQGSVRNSRHSTRLQCLFGAWKRFWQRRSLVVLSTWASMGVLRTWVGLGVLSLGKLKLFPGQKEAHQSWKARRLIFGAKGRDYVIHRKRVILFCLSGYWFSRWQNVALAFPFKQHPVVIFRKVQRNIQ